MHHASLPRARLAHLPTPLEAAERLGARLGLNLWIKRDDCTGLALGGNKTRKLEFTFGDALARGADTLVTAGGYQSNHVRQTAAAAARVGLEFHCVVSAPPAGRPGHYFGSGNLLLDQIMGAHIHVAEDDGAATDVLTARLMEDLAAAGRRPVFVPLGASDAIGAVGYAVCAQELLDQCRGAGFEPAHVVLVTGSAGTHAGLLTGLRALGAGCGVIGVSSSEPSKAKQDKVGALLGPLRERLGIGDAIDEPIEVLDAYVGGGYAVPTDTARHAIELTARLEGLLLDPVYTGKAMAALIDLADKGRFRPNEPVVFLHTGGAPALFVYDDQFWDGLSPS